MGGFDRHQNMESFIRSENIRRYRALLERMTDNEVRAHIKKLLLEEERKQIEAGDFDSDTRQKQAE